MVHRHLRVWPHLRGQGYRSALSVPATFTPHQRPLGYLFSIVRRWYNAVSLSFGGGSEVNRRSKMGSRCSRRQLLPAAAALQAKLNQGMALHRRGKLADAERCYEEVLQRQPDHFDALHLLGVIARQTRRTEWGVDLIKRAIGLNSKVAAAHSNLGNALRDIRRPVEALVSYDRAIALKPDYAAAHSNRGMALRDLKRPAEALASYDKAIALRPDFAAAHYNRGNELMDLKRPEEALASYDRAIALKPDYAKAHSNRGMALGELKRPHEALASYERAIVLKPDFAATHYNRDNELMDLKRPEEALASYDRAIALKWKPWKATIGRSR